MRDLLSSMVRPHRFDVSPHPIESQRCKKAWLIRILSKVFGSIPSAGRLSLPPRLLREWVSMKRTSYQINNCFWPMLSNFNRFIAQDLVYRPSNEERTFAASAPRLGFLPWGRDPWRKNSEQIGGRTQMKHHVPDPLHFLRSGQWNLPDILKRDIVSPWGQKWFVPRIPEPL